jgi:hypothetical protein
MATTRYLATIATGASLSNALPIGAYAPIAVRFPTAWTTAVLTFDASEDGVTYGAVYDADGTELAIQAGAGRFVALPPAPFAGASYIRLRSGTVGSPVNQSRERVVVVLTDQGGATGRFE